MLDVHLQEILQLEDTIVSQVTHGATTGVSIIRVSGSQSHQICRKILNSRLKDPLPAPGTFALRSFYIDSLVVDKGLVLTFANPKSLTGEDVVELHLHGNPVLTTQLISKILSLGARQASPGEFLLRGYRNGKVTLSEVESIGGLLQASSTTATKLFSPNSQARFDRFLHKLRDSILRLWSEAEAYFDFSDEEDVHDNLSFSYKTSLENIHRDFLYLLDIAQSTTSLGRANEVCLLGPPNAGKSSLLNLLVQSDLAIVSDQAGTTRDFIQGEIMINGFLVKVIDTAGLRTSSCSIERQGIARSYSQAKSAQCVLYLQDAQSSSDLADKDLEFLKNISAPKIHVVNKSDLNPSLEVRRSEVFTDLVSISVKEETGIIELKEKILAALNLTGIDKLPFAVNARQHEVAQRAYGCIERAIDDAHCQELSVAHLRRASDILGELLGDQTSDDVLGKIFSQFCIGK